MAYTLKKKSLSLKNELFHNDNYKANQFSY